MTRTTVLIVDDHPVVLDGVRQLLASAGDFVVVAEATSGATALEAARREQPGLVVLDLRLPYVLAPDLCRELRAVVPRARIVILTAFDDRALLQACLDQGAAGVLLKDVHDFDLMCALRDIMAGREVVDERVLQGPSTRAGRLHFGDDEATVYGPLTPREYDVLRLLARGLTTKEIAGTLHLTTNTVRSYAQSLLMKLQARTRIEALAAARRLRLI